MNKLMIHGQDLGIARYNETKAKLPSGRAILETMHTLAILSTNSHSSHLDPATARATTALTMT